MSNFLLVHGSWSDASVWSLVTERLRAAGHNVVTPDLPAHGSDTTDPANATLAGYAEAVERAASDFQGPVVLVGHSMGGTVISTVAEQHPDLVSHLVYVAAFLLPSSQSLYGFTQSSPGMASSLLGPNLRPTETTLGIDPAGLHLSGCSAGGHLAAMTMLAPWARYGLATSPIRSVTLLSGVFDLRPLPLTYVNDAVGMSAEDALRNSPLLLIDTVDGDLPPALIVHGDNEPAEFKRQSREFAEAIERRGGQATVHEIADRNHFDLVFDLANENTNFGALVWRHLGGPGAQQVTQP